MCDFPSWIKDANGVCHWLTDAAVAAAIDGGLIDVYTGKQMTWEDAVGHHAIEQIYGATGKHLEGRSGLPEKFAADIAAGKCSRLLMAGRDTAVVNVPDLVPAGLREKLGIKTIDAPGRYKIDGGIWLIVGDIAVDLEVSGGYVGGYDSSTITSSGQTGGYVRRSDSSTITIDK